MPPGIVWRQKALNHLRGHMDNYPPSPIQWHEQIVQQWMAENRHLIPVEVWDHGFVQIRYAWDISYTASII